VDTLRRMIRKALLVTLIPACALAQDGRAGAQSGGRCLLRAGARYITGYPYVPDAGDGHPKQASGHLLVDTRGIAFCSDRLQPGGWPLASGMPSACDKKQCGQKNELEPIPYENISLLARGRTGTVGGVLSEIAAVAMPVVSLATLVASITTTGATRNWLIGGTLGSAGLAVGIHEILLHRGNYIAVFFGPHKVNEGQDTPCESTPPNAGASSAHPPPQASGGPAGKAAASTPAKTPDLFRAARGCDLAIFQLFNPHDYWNVSTILNARTGEEFVAESAEQK
jgi:hypothetical protein